MVAQPALGRGNRSVLEFELEFGLKVEIRRRCALRRIPRGHSAPAGQERAAAQVIARQHIAARDPKLGARAPYPKRGRIEHPFIPLPYFLRVGQTRGVTGRPVDITA